MIANAQQVILRIYEEEIIIVRIGPVPGIREPEILPDHYSEAIGSVVECLVAHLADPVANHVEVLVLMEAQRSVVLARAIPQHRLGKSPVSPPRDEAASVDPYLQHSAVFGVGE